MSKRVLNKCWGNSFKKLFCPVFHGASSLRNVFKSKNFQNSIIAQNRSQKCPHMFWTSFGVIFPKDFFCPVLHGGSSLRNVFKKILKNSKLQKRLKSFPNCPKVFWTCVGVLFPEISFCPMLHGGSSLRNVFKKSKYFQKSKNAQNRSQIV